MSLLSGLGGLGLNGLEDMDIYGEAEKAEAKKKAQEPAKVEEKDMIYEKTFKCPCCDADVPTKIMKTGKAKLIGTDQDLRPRYEGIDTIKYDVILCPTCGYTALTRFFPNLTGPQAKLIKEKISVNVKIPKYTNDTYSYEEAVDRYQLALANAVVKRGRASEKAYICLKSAWLMRGYRESVTDTEKGTPELVAELKAREEEYIQNAYNGFAEARQNEGFPMCGMDEITIDYLLGVLAAHLKKYDVASRMVSSILTSSAANTRMKDKARDLKEQIMLQIKNNK
ncbi:MAG: DUF2225 domain-containing protein [Eubacterium sp.]|nr:DUF2225 domain-containing protein [Eubacterium sp.]MCM1213253.1 DUF2225 domain-containing protein [Lachnospiraceae bacterium]MCM1303227.1 DUF2225 domain-containing protein [Butyrivibrio sp.]MCM1343192.1 DUF2225 domain-containing protein [Muribaculaceae bacterium]MCM1240018.1 DUF2225 domain-containing protein [Lachnospiraceae bacterium]